MLNFQSQASSGCRLPITLKQNNFSASGQMWFIQQMICVMLMFNSAWPSMRQRLRVPSLLFLHTSRIWKQQQVPVRNICQPSVITLNSFHLQSVKQKANTFQPQQASPLWLISILNTLSESCTVFFISPVYCFSSFLSTNLQAPVSGQCAASSTPSFSAVSPVLPPAPSSPHMPSSICSPQFMHRQVPDPLTPYVVTCAEGWGVCVLPLIAQVPGCDQARSSHDLILPPPDAFLAPNTLLPIAYPPFALTTVHGTMFSHWFNSCLFYGLVMHQKIWVSILISPHCGRNGRRAHQLRVWAAHHHWDSLMSGGETVEGSEQVEDGTLSFAMDAWTSPNHKVYMAVTVHFESNGTPVKMLLNLVEVVCTQVWTLQLHLWQSWMTLILWIRWALNNNPLRNSSPGPRYSVSQAIMIWWLMNLKDWLIVFRSSKLDALFCTSYQSHFKDAIWCT